MIFLFDLFGTVFDMSNVPREELRAYGNHISKAKYERLVLPDSWKTLPAFRDALAGITSLRDSGHLCCTLSNAPIELQMEMLRHNKLDFDVLVDVAACRVFKPNMAVYQYAHSSLQAYRVSDPDEIFMVTANEHFGDLEAASKMGWQSYLVCRGESHRDINTLAEVHKEAEE